MSKRSKPVAIPQSDLMTRQDKGSHSSPGVSCTAYWSLLPSRTAVASLAYVPLVAGVLSVVPLIFAIIAYKEPHHREQDDHERALIYC